MVMQMVESHIINNKQVKDACVKSKDLYNQSLYYTRQVFFGKLEHFSEYELTGLFAKHNEPTYRALPSQTSQQIIKTLFENWKGYWAALKDWHKNPSKYLSKPRIPKYKKEGYVVILTNQQVRIKSGKIIFPAKLNISPLRTHVDNICQVRIVPLANTFKIEVIYEKNITDLMLNKQNVISLDFGLNNLVASINNVGLRPFIINGKPIKSFNQWYNKEKSKLQSYLPNNRRISNRINRLTHFRNCWMEDKLHKVSRFIINHCIENGIGTIIIGKNDLWKTGIDIGRKNNQHFVNIPHARLVDKLKYKSELVGINVLTPEESYTSKIDHLALEPLERQSVYLGKRVKRGLFKSSTGRIINADGNGAIGIGRKVFGDDFVKSLTNSRLVFSHYKVNLVA